MADTNTTNAAKSKLCVFGAGAVGGVIAAKLARAGLHVNAVMRPASAALVRKRGILFQDGDTEPFEVPVSAFERAEEVEIQDIVFVTLKSRSITEAAESIGSLVGPSTVLVPMLNGIPWWYSYQGENEHFQLVNAVDPDGAVSRHLPPPNTVGAVIYFAASMPAPGHIRLAAPGPIVLGEPDGTESARCLMVADLLNAAGFETQVTGAIRQEVWRKLWGNIAYNPVSALTRMTFAEINSSEPLRALVKVLMREAREVAANLGIEISGTVDQRMNSTLRLGAFKSSMLQDLESGRPMEVEAILGAVLELAQRASVDAPRLETIYALLRGQGAAGRPV